MSDMDDVKKPNKKAKEADAGLESDEVNQESIHERLQEIEKRLAKIERESRIGTDDQLFFGLVLSFLLFFLAVPLPDIASFLVTNFGLSDAGASNVALGLKNVFVLFLLLSVAFRYYAALKLNKGFRLWSILFLLIAFDLFLWNLVPNLGSTISLGNTTESRFASISFSYIVLFAIYSFMARFIESNGLKFYANRELLSKRYAKPIVSAFFMSFSGSAVIATLLVEMAFFGFGTLLSVQLQNNIFFLSFVVCLFIYLGFLRKEKVL